MMPGRSSIGRCLEKSRVLKNLSRISTRPSHQDRAHLQALHPLPQEPPEQGASSCWFVPKNLTEGPSNTVTAATRRFRKKSVGQTFGLAKCLPPPLKRTLPPPKDDPFSTIPFKFLTLSLQSARHRRIVLPGGGTRSSEQQGSPAPPAIRSPTFVLNPPRFYFGDWWVFIEAFSSVRWLRIWNV